MIPPPVETTDRPAGPFAAISVPSWCGAHSAARFAKPVGSPFREKPPVIRSLIVGGRNCRGFCPLGVAMHGRCAVSASERVSLQSVNYLGYLVENAERCYRLARGLADPDFTRHLAELGQEYAAQAIERGA